MNYHYLDVNLAEVLTLGDKDCIINEVSPVLEIDNLSQFTDSLDIKCSVYYNMGEPYGIENNTVLFRDYHWHFERELPEISQVVPFIVSVFSPVEQDTVVLQYVQHIVLATIANRLASFLQHRILHLRGLRPAFGYPTCPGHEHKKDIVDLLEVSDKFQLTETYSFIPETTICGLILAYGNNN